MDERKVWIDYKGNFFPSVTASPGPLVFLPAFRRASLRAGRI